MIDWPVAFPLFGFRSDGEARLDPNVGAGCSARPSFLPDSFLPAAPHAGGYDLEIVDMAQLRAHRKVFTTQRWVVENSVWMGPNQLAGSLLTMLTPDRGSGVGGKRGSWWLPWVTSRPRRLRQID